MFSSSKGLCKSSKSTCEHRAQIDPACHLNRALPCEGEIALSRVCLRQTYRQQCSRTARQTVHTHTQAQKDAHLSVQSIRCCVLHQSLNFCTTEVFGDLRQPFQDHISCQERVLEHLCVDEVSRQRTIEHTVSGRRPGCFCSVAQSCAA